MRTATAKALAKLMTAATGEECRLGAPLAPGPGDTFVNLDWETDFELNESGGLSDGTTAYTLVSVAGILGNGDAEQLVVLDMIDGRAAAYKAAIEEDVTLGGLVCQARIRRIGMQSVPGENGWEAGCRIEVEVTEW